MSIEIPIETLKKLVKPGQMYRWKSKEIEIVLSSEEGFADRVLAIPDGIVIDNKNMDDYDLATGTLFCYSFTVRREMLLSIFDIEHVHLV